MVLRDEDSQANSTTAMHSLAARAGIPRRWTTVGQLYWGHSGCSVSPL